MTKTLYAYNAKENQIIEYQEYGDGTTNFPRGIWLTMYDYIITGYHSAEEAEQARLTHGICKKCKKVSVFPTCIDCGATLTPCGGRSNVCETIK